MGRRKRTTFGELTTTRAAFDRAEALCPSCRRPIGPHDRPTFVRGINGASSTLATMRCGRCSAELTVRFLEPDPAG